MEDRSSLLKLYNDRTTILNGRFFAQEDIEDYLNSKDLKISNKLLSTLISYSMVSGCIRPELLIESTLQFLRGKRNYIKELELIEYYFKDCGFLSWETFRDRFYENFGEIYENNEISRILQLVKRFGLDEENVVTYEYVIQLAKTSHIKAFDINRASKKFSQMINKVFLSIS